MRLPSAVTLAVGVVLSASALLPTGAHADLDLRIGVAATDVSLGDALLVGAVGEFFGLETTVVPSFREERDLSLPEILVMMYLARLAGCEPLHVYEAKGRGHGWGQVAHELGIHPGTFNKLRKGFDPGKADDASFEEAVFIWTMAQYYERKPDDLWALRNQKQPFLGIFLALDLSSKSGKSANDLLRKRKDSTSWKALAGSLGVSEDRLKHPGKPKGGKEFRHGQGESGGSGQGNGGNGQGNGGNDHGNGGGNGQGNGGHGKGHGN